MITNVYTPLPGGELELMQQNMGRHKVGGLEVTANGKLSAKLSYNVNGNLSWREVDNLRIRPRTVRDDVVQRTRDVELGPDGEGRSADRGRVRGQERPAARLLRADQLCTWAIGAR